MAALLVTAVFAPFGAQSRIVSSGLLGNRTPNRPAQGSSTVSSSSLSDLRSALQEQVVSLEGALTQSLSKLATALNDNASAATSALQAQISALQSSIATLNAGIASLDLVIYARITRPGVAAQAIPVALQSRISSLRGSIPAINKRATSLVTDLASILPNLRALLSQRVAALTQKVGALNLDVSALAAQVHALIAPLCDALGVADLVALLPQQPGMLRGVLTPCKGLLQAGAAHIQITKMGSSYAVAYQLVATGMTAAPQGQAIYRGSSTCSEVAPPVALQLPGTWELLTSMTWSLANVLTVAPGGLADVLSAIQAGASGELYLGFQGSSSNLAGKLVGTRF